MTIVPNDTTRPWNPLPVGDLVTLMRGAGFFWCLAGGHAIERVVGRPYRAHEDIDIVVLRPEQSSVQQWLADWYLAAADPPGMLRPWESGERLPWRVHDIWGRRLEAQSWELQVMIQEADSDSWYFRRDDRVHGSLSDLAVVVDGVPCLRMELQLLYKAKSAREKDEADFEQLLPLLDESQRRTLVDWLRLTCPNGHHWIPPLEGWGV